MAPLLQELSSLEVEPLEIIVNTPETEQGSSLDTLTPVSGIAGILTGKGVLPVNDEASCCCCCCPVCCC